MVGGGTSRAFRGADEGELDAAARAVFRLALAEGALAPGPRTRAACGLDEDAFDRAGATLLRMRLLRPATDRPGVLLPVNPEVAAAELSAPLKSAIADAEARMRSVSVELGTLVPEYLASRRTGRQYEPVQVLPDEATAAAVLAQETEQCREEVFAVRSESPLTATGPEALARDLALLGRGVRLRTLFRLTSRPSGPVREQARRLAAAGAQYRRAPELPAGAVLLDRSVAFVPRTDGGVLTGALLIRDAGTVEYLWQVLEHLWSTSLPFDTSAPGELPEGSPRERAGGEVRRAVVRLLAEGAKDEMIARRLGISLRTCRRHIADVLDTLHAASRFQGGVLAERAGLTGFLAGTGAGVAGADATDG